MSRKVAPPMSGHPYASSPVSRAIYQLEARARTAEAALEDALRLLRLTTPAVGTGLQTPPDLNRWCAARTALLARYPVPPP